ncbi:MAG: transferrin-binding protein-like solute binding protein, partial [Pseudomonadota bacterium]
NVNTQYASQLTSSSTSLQAVNASVIFNSSTSADLTVDGVTYALTFNSAASEYQGTSGGKTITLEYFSVGGANVDIVYFAIADASSLLDAYAPIGNVTDPANMPSSGTAVYNGILQGYANYSNGSSDPLTGPVTFNIDFGASNISGSGTINDAGTSATFGSFTVPMTSIVGNTFAVTPTVSLTDPSASVNGASVEGDFFGPAGEDVAGAFAATGTNSVGVMTIQGVFGAN